jgi:alkanesulfonate monooxygenase SsuD/methylene tetrahydromethanopterin reductase-like flavin-dependent oxidoreductase (luciferase family)
MRFGVFDQNDWRGGSVAEQYAMRLELISLYEELGFYCYHMSEHHGTPLSTAPSPSVFLAAVSQRTKNLNFGPLVYLLPVYNPLRLTEEICMLDNLSNGRFQFGVGRGASPHEIGYLGVAADDMQPMYAEALDIILSGLAKGVVNHRGRFWNYDNVELSLQPVQRPHPPLWVAMGGAPDSAVWPAHHGAHIVVGAPAVKARAVFERYIAERKAVSGHVTTDPFMGLNRWIVVMDSDEEAIQIASRAWKLFYSYFIKLWLRHGGTPAIKLSENFEQMLASGTVIVGSPDTVRARLADQITTSGANFISGVFAFGDLSFSEVETSVRMFAEAVMPELTLIGRNAHASLLVA